MKIAIGADHRGYAHKEFIKAHFELVNHVVDWIDVGVTHQHRTDYPPFAQKVCALMQSGEVDRGILICGSGVGMAITANRFAHIYAAVAWNAEIARVSVEHDNVNVLVIPSDFVSAEQLLELITAWATALFCGNVYQARLAMIDELGGIVSPRSCL